MGIQMLNHIGQNFSLTNLGASQGIKKNLDEKIQEKNQIYGYIGMEVCDLCQSGKLSVPQLEVYFEKLREAEREIAALEAQLAAVKPKNPFSAGRCSCGYSLKSGVKFCPRCGKPAEPEMITCSCGRQIEKGVSFCQDCGRKVSELPAVSDSLQPSAAEPQMAAAAEEIQEKECICGARIPAGQTMCMECGRVIL